MSIRGNVWYGGVVMLAAGGVAYYYAKQNMAAKKRDERWRKRWLDGETNQEDRISRERLSGTTSSIESSTFGSSSPSPGPSSQPRSYSPSNTISSDTAPGSTSATTTTTPGEPQRPTLRAPPTGVDTPHSVVAASSSR